ncbi:MAG TPA: DUF4397 domain-containing protein [Niastella sp.]|nr:DUF4397 domain-containing protein [Niastella sp.]
MKKQFSFQRFIAVAATVMLMAGVLTACKKTDGVATRIPSAGLMVFNLAPDKDGIGVALSGNLVNSVPLRFTSYNGTYQSIYTGERNIQALDLSDSIFAESTSTFEDNNYYSLFVTGNNGVYKAVTVKDDVDSSATADKAYVRYINAIPDSSAPQVTFAVSGTNILEGAASFNTVTPFTAVSGGEVKVSLAGENMAADRTFTIENGHVYTVLLVGVPGATDAAKKVQIRFVENGVIPASADK